MADELGANLEVTIVMQGKKQGYSIQLRLTMPMPKDRVEIVPDLDSFIDGLYFLNKQRLYKDEKAAEDAESQAVSYSTKADTQNG